MHKLHELRRLQNTTTMLICPDCEASLVAVAISGDRIAAICPCGWSLLLGTATQAVINECARLKAGAS